MMKTERCGGEKLPTDADNKPYLRCQQHIAPYTKTEVFKDDSGTQCSRLITVPASSLECPNFDLASAGWFKKLEWREISKKEVYVPIADSVGFERKSALVLSTYIVDVDKHKCLHCEANKEKYDFIKPMPSGIYRRCFKTDITTSFYRNDFMEKHDVFRLISEKPVVTAKEAKQLIASGVYADLSLKRELGVEE